MKTEILNYNLISAHEAGEDRHAQIVMREIADRQGLKIIDAIAAPIGDCWVFCVEFEDAKTLDDLPVYLRNIKEWLSAYDVDRLIKKHRKEN